MLLLAEEGEEEEPWKPPHTVAETWTDICDPATVTESASPQQSGIKGVITALLLHYLLGPSLTCIKHLSGFDEIFVKISQPPIPYPAILR